MAKALIFLAALLGFLALAANADGNYLNFSDYFEKQNLLLFFFD